MLAVCCLAAFAPAGANAAFSPPVDLAPIGSTGVGWGLGIAPNGNALATFAYQDPNDPPGSYAKVRARTPAGALGPMQELYPAVHLLGMDADGDALIVGYEASNFGSSVLAQTRSAAGQVGPVQTLAQAPHHVFDDRLAVAANGDAVVAWEQQDENFGPLRAYARAVSTDGTLGPLYHLAGGGEYEVNGIDVAINDNGDAVLVWGRGLTAENQLPGGHMWMEARTLSASGALGPVQSLTPPAEKGVDFGGTGFPQVVMEQDGDALAVWERSGKIEARAFSAVGGQWGPLEPIFDGGFNPQVALDADGDALIVEGWNLTPNGVRARARSSTGVLGNVETISQEGSTPQVGVDAAGNAVIAWVGCPAGEDPCQPVKTRARSVDGTLGPIEKLSPAGVQADWMQMAVNPSGCAVVVWTARGEVIGQDIVQMSANCTEPACFREVVVLANIPSSFPPGRTQHGDCWTWLRISRQTSIRRTDIGTPPPPAPPGGHHGNCFRDRRGIFTVYDELSGRYNASADRNWAGKCAALARAGRVVPLQRRRQRDNSFALVAHDLWESGDIPAVVEHLPPGFTANRVFLQLYRTGTVMESQLFDEWAQSWNGNAPMIQIGPEGEASWRSAINTVCKESTVPWDRDDRTVFGVYGGSQFLPNDLASQRQMMNAVKATLNDCTRQL